MKIKTNMLPFFKDINKSYVLNCSLLIIFNVINRIPKSTGLWDDNNIELKYFDGDSFSIQLIKIGASGGGRRNRLSSILYGEIEKKNESETILRIKIKASNNIYFSFFFCIIGGLIFLGKFIFLRGSAENFFGGVLMIFVLPYLLIWYKKVTDTGVRKNFEEYLFKKLKKL